MSKTKFIKVSIEERMPEETDTLMTSHGWFTFDHGSFYNDEDEEISYVNYWLEEVPDREEEMRDAVKELLRFRHEMKSVMREKLQYPDNFLKAVENLEQLLNK